MLKIGMGLKLLPCGKLRVKVLIVRMADIALNLPRAISQRAMAAAMKDGRFKVKFQGHFRLLTVLWDIAKVSCKLVKQAGQNTVCLGRRLL